MMDGYIAVAGSLNYDILVKQERLPEKGETYTADSVAYEGGGKGANQAVQCAKLGVPTYMVGKVGQDFALADVEATADRAAARRTRRRRRGERREKPGADVLRAAATHAVFRGCRRDRRSWR